MIDILLNRVSVPAHLLAEPVPSASQLEQALKAAVTAPDHGALRPWRFVVIEKEGRNRLGEQLAEAAKMSNPDMLEEKLQKLKEKPLRSPMIIAVFSKTDKENNKVPEFEQVVSAGVAAQQLQLALQGMGFASIWLSGPYTNSPPVKQLLGAVEADTVVGFVYVGTSSIQPPQPARPDPSEFVTYLRS